MLAVALLSSRPNFPFLLLNCTEVVPSRERSAEFVGWIHLRVLGFGLLQDGDVGVGVFPECKPKQGLTIHALPTALPEPARLTLCQ
jgi:hypothetical protein